jgi:hypothetical protein
MDGRPTSAGGPSCKHGASLDAHGAPSGVSLSASIVLVERVRPLRSAIRGAGQKPASPCISRSDGRYRAQSLASAPIEIKAGDTA